MFRILLLSVVLFMSSTASAQLLSFSTRFGSAETKVVFGVVNGRVAFIEQRVSDGRCELQNISTNGVINGHVSVFTGDGINRVRVISTQWDLAGTFCGRTVTRMGRFIGAPTSFMIKGGAGNDIFLSSGHFTQIMAGAGHDTIVSHDHTSLNGEDGDDYIIELNDLNLDGGFAGALGGGPGNDRLCDLANGSNMDGGIGTDWRWNANRALNFEGMMSNGDECGTVALIVLWSM